MKIRRSFVGALLLVLSLFFFQNPIKAMARRLLYSVKGKRTTSSVVEELRPVMVERFSNWRQLTDGRELVILVFKEERRVELWKQTEGSDFEEVTAWKFTKYCGKLGPKLAEGDWQIPEGVYEIEYLNPNSSYHLSMKVNYPNAFDREMAKRDGRKNLGGDIMIHGKEVTIGCVPIGDPGIEELFFLIAENGYKNARVVMAPRDFRKANAENPESPGVAWSEELYGRIRSALKPFSQP